MTSSALRKNRNNQRNPSTNTNDSTMFPFNLNSSSGFHLIARDKASPCNAQVICCPIEGSSEGFLLLTIVPGDHAEMGRNIMDMNLAFVLTTDLL